MNGRLIPCYKTNPCPVCGPSGKQQTGKCRTKEGTDLVLCMNHQDARVGDSPINGYRCVKANDGKGWASFVPDRDYTPAEREALHRQLQEALKQEDRRRKTRTENSLSAAQRDKEYRQILAQLALNEHHRAMLRTRGFTEDEIARSGYVSVTNFQKLTAPASPHLPGASKNGNSLSSFPGLLLPVRDHNNYIVGAQIRVDGAEDGNRYRWLSSNSRQDGLGQSPHLPNGELPLSVLLPAGESSEKVVALVEGVGIKPYLACERLNVPVIGSAGGQWASSPSHFEAAMNDLDEMGAERLRVYPDAGDVLNKEVMDRWARTFAWLEQEGYAVEVAWWGQVNKQHADIDELTSAQRQHVRLITPASFIQKRHALSHNTKSSAKTMSNSPIEKEDSNVVPLERTQNTENNPMPKILSEVLGMLPMPSGTPSEKTAVEMIVSGKTVYRQGDGKTLNKLRQDDITHIRDSLELPEGAMTESQPHTVKVDGKTVLRVGENNLVTTNTRWRDLEAAAETSSAPSPVSPKQEPKTPKVSAKPTTLRQPDLPPPMKADESLHFPEPVLFESKLSDKVGTLRHARTRYALRYLLQHYGDIQKNGHRVLHTENLTIRQQGRTLSVTNERGQVVFRATRHSGLPITHNIMPRHIQDECLHIYRQSKFEGMGYVPDPQERVSRLGQFAPQGDKALLQTVNGLEIARKAQVILVHHGRTAADGSKMFRDSYYTFTKTADGHLTIAARDRGVLLSFKHGEIAAPRLTGADVTRLKKLAQVFLNQTKTSKGWER